MLHGNFSKIWKFLAANFVFWMVILRGNFLQRSVFKAEKNFNVSCEKVSCNLQKHAELRCKLNWGKATEKLHYLILKVTRMTKIRVPMIFCRSALTSNFWSIFPARIDLNQVFIDLNRLICSHQMRLIEIGEDPMDISFIDEKNSGNQFVPNGPQPWTHQRNRNTFDVSWLLHVLAKQCIH